VRILCACNYIGNHVDSFSDVVRPVPCAMGAQSNLFVSDKARV
jgi:hypothetical protein